MPLLNGGTWGSKALYRIDSKNRYLCKKKPMAKIIKNNPAETESFRLCGYKNLKNQGYRNKIEWINQQTDAGLQYHHLVDESNDAVGSVEYMMGENSWRPVNADGYLVIHCLCIMSNKYKGKGYGGKLLQTVIDDAKKQKANGVVCVTRKGTWMPKKPLFLKHGFEVCDTMKPDFELMVLRLNQEAPLPVFANPDAIVAEGHKEGLVIYTSDQCPYALKATTEIAETAQKEFGLQLVIAKLENADEAQQMPTPFGNFCVVLNGEVIAWHPISKTRFRNIMNKQNGKS
jgi:L-amino acid N-acyltransferase YncA